MAKTDATLGMRLSSADKAALRERARAASMSVAAYVRQQALATGSGQGAGGPTPAVPAGHPAPPAVETYHIDDLGPDTLRIESGALSR